MSTLITRAAEFAKAAHGEQVRKYTGEPYWHHLMRVAEIVSRRTHDEELVAAAWLHDTLEDTPVSYGELAAEFGTRVADLVLELTDVYTKAVFPHLNRAERKAMEARRLRDISPAARLIKLADIYDNTQDIDAHDPAFARVYRREKQLMLLNLEIASHG